MKETLKKGFISFAISAICGLIVNLVIDIVVNACGVKGFVSMSDQYVAMFPTTAMAAYVNILVYGLIGFVFATMTFIYEVERLGFLFQSIIYFIVTGGFGVAVTQALPSGGTQTGPRFRRGRISRPQTIPQEVRPC